MSFVEQSAAKPPAAPRLGVIHFLLWMLGCAAANTGYRVFTHWELISAEDLSSIRLMHLGMSMAYGVGVVTAYVWLHCLWRRDRSFPTQPGHWLLLVGAAAAVLDGTATLVVRWLLAGTDRQWEEWYIVQWAGWGAGALVIAAVLWEARLEARWRAPIVLLLLLAVWYSAIQFVLWRSFGQGLFVFTYTLPIHLQAAGIAAASLAAAGAVLADLIFRTRRDWLHWTGVTVCLSLAFVQTAMYVRFYWLR